MLQPARAICTLQHYLLSLFGGGGGGGGKALTMTMTPWNLLRGQWSKKLTMTMTTWNLPWSMVKIDQFYHGNNGILSMVMVKNGQF